MNAAPDDAAVDRRRAVDGGHHQGAGGGRFRVGTSGYDYEHWAGVFYPDALSRRSWFDHYAAVFDSVEINATFYRLPDATIFDAWRERAPDGFLYALKFSRYGTHLKHLESPREVTGTFLRAARRLGDHLGPILVQLPPRWKANPGRLERFLDAAASDVRWAVELRDPSWLSREVFDVLSEAGAALCIHDMIDDHPREVTTDWTYLRYHGRRYAGSYSHQKLTAEAEWIAGRLEKGDDVYAYFNNDAEGHAPNDACDLRRYVATRSRPGDTDV